MTSKTKIRHEVECLRRLNELTPVYEELLQFLKAESLLSSEQLKVIRLSPEIDRAKLLQEELDHLAKDSKIQLLAYEWSILPTEVIRITVITDKTHREFVAEV